MGALGTAIDLPMLRLGIHIRRANRFPPASVKLVVDTRIVRGARAQKMAPALTIGGALFAPAAAGLALGLHTMTRDMLGPLQAPMAAPSGERG